ncbi:MAG: VWA domain-containing protein, partial [Actinobacteria bacterium]|nr:VWA domain-containing protein [Actinomycetota bacterium]
RDAADDVPGGRGDGSGGSGGSGSGTQGNPAGGGFADRFTRDELRAAVAEFRRRVEIESRRRNAEARGPERISRYAVRPPAEQTPFLLAGATEVQELRSTITPLAKKLASRMAAKRRRAARGEIDIRKTLRRSMSTGGVPIRPALRRRSPHRPDLVLLCDLSSSVAGFSRFTILLMQAMAGQFRRIRIFGFVNVCDELTETVLSAPPGSDLTAAFTDTARMTRWHRNSDYGTALVDFTDRYLDAVGHRTTVLILGDARTNNTEPRLDALAEIVARAKRVDWLNPESPSQWGAGDSVAHLYGQTVDMHECANAVQLRQFVMRLMPV